jgi:hypothetical protein
MDPSSVPPVVRNIEKAYVAAGITEGTGKPPKRSWRRRLFDRARRKGDSRTR